MAERFMDTARDLGCLYWLFVPAYVIYYIVFCRCKGPDPLGLYGRLIESGEYEYD